MEIGKVPENVLKRAVFKQIKHRREEVILHPGVGEDCSAVVVTNISDYIKAVCMEKEDAAVNAGDKFLTIV